jgi:glycosyltransferase involved in cell wall biosynthesis
MLSPQDMTSSPVAVSIIVPCFNEEAGLLDLHRKLQSVQVLLESKYDVRFLLVDDGSTDNTWKAITSLFQHEPNYILLRHSANLGIGAAIRSGILAATTEIVCSIDSDCSYDPVQLEKLLPMLTPGVDLVTASPYHCDGEVYDVSRWRLFLSKTASHLYRRVLTHKLCTYTSCFRVYRRSRILNLSLRRQRFLAVAELIGKLDLQGCGIAECPARLTRRTHGVSKMKTARVVMGHVLLLAELLASRVVQTLCSHKKEHVALPDFTGS